jgi:Zn-dependent peptidase ImmA (M78 family)/DNA-binding XRE family transcriptional regulator
VAFNRRMITLARDAVGLTQSSLAHQIGISQGLISKIENGLEEPAKDLLDRIGQACGVPASFFEQQDEILGDGLIDYYHKKRLTLPAKPLKKANALANLHRLEALRLLRTLEFAEAADFPVFLADEHQSVEVIAQLVRATWRVPPGPLPNLIALIEATGVPIFVVDLGHEKLSAISMPGISGRHVIILNGSLPPSAQRFALAHELGHLVMHGGTASDDMEREADLFAAALLMPADQIRTQLRGLQFKALGALKAQWRVSLAALIRRAHDLHCISDRQYKTFNIGLNRLPGGRKREPGEFEAERPRLIKHLFHHYRTELDYSIEDLRTLMVVTDERLRTEYLDEPVRKLRSVNLSRVVHDVSLHAGIYEH